MNTDMMNFGEDAAVVDGHDPEVMMTGSRQFYA